MPNIKLAPVHAHRALGVDVGKVIISLGDGVDVFCYAGYPIAIREGGLVDILDTKYSAAETRALNKFIAGGPSGRVSPSLFDHLLRLALSRVSTRLGIALEKGEWPL